MVVTLNYYLFLSQHCTLQYINYCACYYFYYYYFHYFLRRLTASALQLRYITSGWIW